MFGPRLNTIFASRWKALWWAAAVLFTAWQLTPAPDANDDGQAAPSASASTNPWAKSNG